MTPATPKTKSRSGRSGAAKERLERYRKKRRFDVTSEPAGDGAPRENPEGPRFVVQRHRARRLHYDFRLEIAGVLVSWAVPKGLTLDPKERHLAIHVEDHPLEYMDFEGVIPAGEYGGGDVIVWDRGTWELHRDPDPLQAVADGELHLELYGEKLRGRFVLIRTKKSRDDKEQWLVLHKKDEFAVPGWDPEEHDTSVLSGRNNDEVAAAPEREWTREGERVLAPPAPRFELAQITPEELAALGDLGAKGEWEVGGRSVKLSNLDKVLFPATEGSPEYTKRDLIRYYASVGPHLLPYLVDHPLNLRRYPDGIDGKTFWQKQAPKYTPDWISRWHNPDADPDESQEYLVADSIPALVWLANHAAIELHPWTSRGSAPDSPLYALIDLDPGTETSPADLLTLARLHRTALEHLGVRGYPKTSGQRGLQIWIPIAAGPTFAETREWVEELSHAIGKVTPELVSWSWEKESRGGLARLDYTQNARNKTLVAPYSVRAAPRAPVSTPITWDEIDDPDFRPDRWTIPDVSSRLDEVGDLMAGALHDPQKLPSLS